MANSNSPEQFFREQVDKYGQRLSEIKKRIRQVAMFRIFSFLITLLGIYLTASHSFYQVAGVAIPGFSLFGFFVYRHLWLFRKKKLTERFLEINENELRLLHLDTSRQPEGFEFLDASHPYAADLDVFGKRSLFQLIDRSATIQGRQKLAEMLLYPEKEKFSLQQRQEAIGELAGKPHWRQAFQISGGQHEKDAGSMANLLLWIQNDETFFDRPLFLFFLVLVPLLGFTLVALMVFGWLPYSSFLLFLVLPFAVLMPHSQKINKTFGLLGRKTLLLQQYALLFQKLEQGRFSSEVMKRAQDTLTNGSFSAFYAVRRLSAISKMFDYRLNMLMGIVLNIFFLWDILQCFRLERWKKKYRKAFPEWFEILENVDALCSLAGFAFQHSEAVYPQAVSDHFIVRGKNLKHPFIDPKHCVGNPVDIEGWSRFHVITGANMAGKSTYLRTIGVNYLLAMTGAPVLADDFVFTPIQLFTGIKTSDSLQDGESYFFAELKRLKEMISRLEKGEKLFVILDEILRGTNSKDKQKGSKALLQQLIKLGASGIIATHDLSLGELADAFPGKVINKRFEVEIINDKLFFDYRLKEGISQNLNATFLMKKMGITV